MKYSITSIKSEIDGMHGTWVSIGFRSKDEEPSMLHIVGGSAREMQPGGLAAVPIYFERDDQALSCYEGAEKIIVGRDSVTVVLNKVGQDSLELPKTVDFISTKPSRDFTKAVATFKKMKTLMGGEVIRAA